MIVASVLEVRVCVGSSHVWGSLGTMTCGLVLSNLPEKVYGCDISIQDILVLMAYWGVADEIKDIREPVKIEVCTTITITTITLQTCSNLQVSKSGKKRFAIVEMDSPEALERAIRGLRPLAFQQFWGTHIKVQQY